MLVLVVMGWKGAGDSLGGPMYRGGGVASGGSGGKKRRRGWGAGWGVGQATREEV